MSTQTRTGRDATASSPWRGSRLRTLNLALAALHAAQAVAIVVLSNDFALPVTARYQQGPPGADQFGDPVTLFDLRYGYAIAAFLTLAALDHLLVASPKVVDWYERNLDRGVNNARWIEYSLSASLMIVLIAMLTGITTIFALIPIFVVNASMILFGLLMERVNPDRDRVDWWPYLFGCIAGIAPWIVITIAIVGAEVQATGPGVPTFVYAIFVSLFVLFNSFAVNMVLQYRKVGPWRDYRFGEAMYLLLSLTAKSALAWQIFAGTLQS